MSVLCAQARQTAVDERACPRSSSGANTSCPVWRMPCVARSHDTEADWDRLLTVASTFACTSCVTSSIRGMTACSVLWRGKTGIARSAQRQQSA